jgi:hypothetical protein
MWDVFISHASEDKDAIARPLAEALRKSGLHVWYDEYTLKIGDSLRRSIDQGLSESTYGIVILSKAFFAKNWPQKELDGLFAREIGGKEVILPIWHDLTKEDVEKYSPMLADKFAANSKDDMCKIVEMILGKFERIISHHTISAEIIPTTLPQMGDQAVMEKIKRMCELIPPTPQVISDAAISGDYFKMGLNAALLKMYLDNNLPEMKQLAEKATTKKTIAQEFISMLENLRTSSDLTMKATDKYNSGNINEAIQLMGKVKEFNRIATEHLNQTNALL